MRDLTSAEYRTILAVLSHPKATERERIRSSRLPSSTYNVARRRIFDSEWLSDVMIPNPGPFGLAGIEFVLVRPTLGERAERIRNWSLDPGCCLLWSGIHAVFGVFLRGRVGSAEPGRMELEASAGLFRVFAGRRSGSVPVYFDYSGLWARFGGEPPPASYPIGLDTTSAPSDPRTLHAAEGILQNGPNGGPDAPRWTNLLRLSKSPRRALARGLLRSSSVLHPGRLPPYEGRRIAEIIFIEGRLRPSKAAIELLANLTGRCGVYPFLVAESDGKVILAGLGQTRSNSVGRAPVVSARAPVMGTIAESLEPAEVLIEPVEAVEELVAQRYAHALSIPREPRVSSDAVVS